MGNHRYLQTSFLVLTADGESPASQSCTTTCSVANLIDFVSQSYLQSSGSGISFHGHLDIDTLGGAGFASQRSAGDDRRWDLSSFAGVELSIDPSQSNNNLYTLIFKDHTLPPNPENGREQSTVSWEYDFSKSNCHVETGADSSSASIFIPWDHFRPTYRGKPCSDTRCLDLSGIKRISIMIRRFAGWSG